MKANVFPLLPRNPFHKFVGRWRDGALRIHREPHPYDDSVSETGSLSGGAQGDSACPCRAGRERKCAENLPWKRGPLGNVASHLPDDVSVCKLKVSALKIDMFRSKIFIDF